MAKQSGAKRKKGPKGKKARSKAKLDRQWGEEAKNDSGKTYQRGRARESDTAFSNDMTKSEKQDHQEQDAYANAPRNIDTSESDSDSDSDVEIQTASPENALSNLLQSISARKNLPNLSASKSTAANEEYLEEEEEEQSDDSTTGWDDIDIDDDLDDAMDEEVTDPSLDLFHDRFRREPLVKDELSNKLSINIPLDDVHELQLTSSSVKITRAATLLREGKAPEVRKLSMDSFSCVRKNLSKRWRKRYPEVFRPSQANLYAHMARYMDVLVPTQSSKARSETEDLVLMHLLNHVLTSRTRIRRNNKRAKEDEDRADSEYDGETLRDQGFTRPTVLVLLPTRGTCHQVVHAMTKMLGIALDNEYSARFEEEFGPPQLDGDDADEPLEARRKKVLEQKGRAWSKLFGDSKNSDDDFKLGLAVGMNSADRSGKKKTSMKLYTNFYKSDIILASPLALKLLTTKGGGEDDEDEEGKVDTDFLSSIEICFLGYADVMLMQNWDHVNHVMSLLNLQPKSNNDTDFSRVRNYHLEGQSAHWRQLVFLSSFLDPSIVSTFSRFAMSWTGSLKLRERIQLQKAALSDVAVPVKQVFQQVVASTFQKKSEVRLTYFKKSVLPLLLKTKQKHTLIFVPSYFDFVCLRNLLMEQEVDFVSVHEYSRVSETSRARARFVQGRKPIMLYTGRCHFFLRHTIKGTRHLIFYGLPEYPNFYSDHVNLLEEAELNGETSCLSLFTKYDGHALERIVGTTHCMRMLKGDKNTFMFYS